MLVGILYSRYIDIAQLLQTTTLSKIINTLGTNGFVATGIGVSVGVLLLAGPINDLTFLNIFYVKAKYP